MMSMVCEDMMQSYLNISDDDSPKSRFLYFNYNYPYGMTYWFTGDNVLISYANAYAFGAYLARNYGGAELIHEIASNNSVDMDSITAALQAQGYSETCTSVFLKEGQALVYTDSDSAENHPSFNKSVTNSVGGYDFTFSAVNLTLSSYQADASSAVPSIFSAYEQDIPLGPWGFSVHAIPTTDGTQIAYLSGDQSFDLAARSANEVLYVLVN
jgi:hypothetical protein